MKAEGNLLDRWRLCSRRRGWAPGSMPSRKPQPPGASSSLMTPPPTFVGAGQPADASSHPSPSHRVPGAVKSPTPGTPDASGCPALAQACGWGATILAGRQRLCVPSVSVEPGRMAASRGLPFVLATTRCGRRPLFCGTDGAPRRRECPRCPAPAPQGCSPLLAPPAASTPVTGGGAARPAGSQGRTGSAGSWLFSLEGSGTREGCWGAGLWDLGGSRRGGEARPRFQLGKRAGLVLAGISVRHEPSP